MLIAMTGLSESTVQRSIKSLSRAKIIATYNRKVRHGEGFKQLRNSYRLVGKNTPRGGVMVTPGGCHGDGHLTRKNGAVPSSFADLAMILEEVETAKEDDLHG
jgi:DNA-binding Lrp family transcriptional regulator